MEVGSGIRDNFLVSIYEIIPSKKEINENVRSRSAKLRYIVKTKDVFEFDTDVFDKFKTLIEIENFGSKL